MKKTYTLVYFLISAIGCLFAETATAEDGTGLQISAAGDIVGQVATHSNSAASDRLDIREAEVLLYAPVDNLFEARIGLAAHFEGGQRLFETHEILISSSTLIPRSRFRLGQFFLGFGRLNQTHRHDWPFITAPKVQQEFFDEEALLDTGIEYSYLLPLPFYLDLTVGITNGWVFGHAHNVGEKPYIPTHYARLATYFSLFSEGGLQVALNYVGRKANGGENRSHVGLDAVAKWRQNRRLVFLLQTENWYRALTPRGSRSEKTFAGYLFPQYGLSDLLYLGMRLDYFTITNLQNVAGQNQSNFVYALVPTLTVKPSEFSTFRLAYTFEESRQGGSHTGTRGLFELQAVFILGAHPAHDF